MKTKIINNSILCKKNIFLHMYTYGIRISNTEFLCVKTSRWNIKYYFILKIPKKNIAIETDAVPTLSESDIEDIKKYFKENKFNKYSIWFVISRFFMSHDSLSNILSTQFPVIDFSNPTENLNDLIEKGDVIFSVNFQGIKNYLISSIITKWDLGMFSHVESVLEKDGILYVIGVGLDGGYCQSLKEYFDNLNNTSRHIAVYRLNSESPNMWILDDEWINNLNNMKYAFLKVFVIFICRLFGIQSRMFPPTVSELMYNTNYKFKLIGYK